MRFTLRCEALDLFACLSLHALPVSCRGHECLLIGKRRVLRTVYPCLRGKHIPYSSERNNDPFNANVVLVMENAFTWVLTHHIQAGSRRLNHSASYILYVLWSWWNLMIKSLGSHTGFYCGCSVHATNRWGAVSFLHTACSWWCCPSQLWPQSQFVHVFKLTQSVRSAEKRRVSSFSNLRAASLLLANDAAVWTSLLRDLQV